MTGPIRRFTPDELSGSDQPASSEAELADALAAARVLEGYAARDHIAPTDGFEERVMSAIAAEPAPRVVVRPSHALRGGRAGAFVAAVGDAWAIATRGGRPAAVRAQALAFLLVVGLAVGSLGSLTAVGVDSLLQSRPTPQPSVQPVVTDTPSPSPSTNPSATPSPSPSPSSSPSPGDSTEAPGAAGTTDPTQTPDGTERPDDHGDNSALETPDATDAPNTEDTPKPGETLRPGETLKPGETPDSTDDHGGSSDG